MPNNPHLENNPLGVINRRVPHRQKLRSVAYIDLGPSNGGLVLNVSEKGMALSAALKFVADDLPRMRFKLPGIQEWIETDAEVVWMSESRKEAGVKFEQLDSADARRIREWILNQQDADLHMAHVARESSAAPAHTHTPENEEGRVRFEQPEGLTKEFAKTNPGPAAAANSAREEGFAQYEPISKEPHFGSSISPPVPAGPVTLVPEEKPAEWPSSMETSSIGAEIALPKRIARGPIRGLGVLVASIVGIALVSFGAGVVIERTLQKSPQQTPIELRTPKPPDNPSPDNTVPPGNALSNDTAASEHRQPNIDAGSEKSSSSEPAAYADATQGYPAVAPPESNHRRTSSPARSNAAIPPENNTSSKARTELAAQERAAEEKLANARTVMPQKDAAPPVANPMPKQSADTSSKETTAAQPELVSVDKLPHTSVDRIPGVASPKDDAAAAANTTVPPTVTSITTRVPPFPSMRIPSDVNSSASRAGKSVQMGRLLTRIEPTYPPEAAQQQIQGTVKLHVAISADGAIQNVEADGPPLLAQAAMKAVRQWRYTPTVLGGQPIEADEDILFVFRLSQRPSATTPSP